MKTNHVYLLIGLLIIQAGCLPAGDDTGSAVEPAVDGLAGTAWMLTAYGPSGNEMAALTHTAITATFADGQMHGSTGCNSYSTTYMIDGRILTLGPIAVTEMACLELGVMEQEVAILSALSTAASFELVNETLTVTYEGGSLRFGPKLPPVPRALEGAIWRLETLEQREGDVVMGMPVPEGMLITLTFQASQLSGSTGCNDFGAPYQVNGGQLTVDAITKTEALCPDEVQILTEAQFFNGLEKAESFTITTDQLAITYPGGSLIFRKQALSDTVSSTESYYVQQAQETLTTFYDHLHNGRYADAAALYGGSYEAMVEHNPDFDANDQAGLLQQACMVNGAICLGVETAVLTNQPNPDEFHFLVEFADADGTPFTIQLPEQPPQTQFPVTIQMTESGSYRIVTPLAYSP